MSLRYFLNSEIEKNTMFWSKKLKRILWKSLEKAYNILWLTVYHLHIQKSLSLYHDDYQIMLMMNLRSAPMSFVQPKETCYRYLSILITTH